jgi:hypothetical protein
LILFINDQQKKIKRNPKQKPKKIERARIFGFSSFFFLSVYYRCRAKNPEGRTSLKFSFLSRFRSIRKKKCEYYRSSNTKKTGKKKTESIMPSIEKYPSLDELIELSGHAQAWLNRGPFIQQAFGFEQMIQLLKDPLLFEYMNCLRSQGYKVISLDLFGQKYVLVVDPALATDIFRETIPYFPPGIFETNISGMLAPMQTTLTMGELWEKRRCLSEKSFGFTPLHSQVPIHTIDVCPSTNVERRAPQIVEKNFFWRSLATEQIERWLQDHELPTEHWADLYRLSARIAFGTEEGVDFLILYMRQAQSLPSLLGSGTVPFPNYRTRYRDFLRRQILDPVPGSMAEHIVNVASRTGCYTSEEMEDQLPFLFFQVGGIFTVFLPIALALACIDRRSGELLYRCDGRDVGRTDNYLHFFVMEVLRLYNQVFVLQRTTGENVTVRGEFETRTFDQIVLPFAYYLRDSNTYPDPNRFSPLRWRDESCIPWDRGQHPFSSGSRTCPARNFALHIAKYTLLRLWKNGTYRYILESDLCVDLDDMPQIIDPYRIHFSLQSRY